MKRFGSITRKAILIGCPGNISNPLLGVKRDILNMSRFLLSNKGGAWNKNEIVVLDNPNLVDVSKIIQSIFVDYLLVYFSGHGYTDVLNNSRMLALKDSNIPDWHLLNNSPRQLVIVDACRNYLAPGLSGVPVFEDSVDHFEGPSVYELFNEYIALSPEGKLIVHATQPGKYSYDSPSGGYFTQALLHVSTRMKTESEYSPCSIKDVLSHVPVVLTRSQNHQIPSVSYKEGNLTVPFALGSSIPALSSTPRETSNELVGAMLLTFLLIGVAVAVASN